MNSNALLELTRNIGEVAQKTEYTYESDKNLNTRLGTKYATVNLIMIL
jgi:hypothetical protein